LDLDLLAEVISMTEITVLQLMDIIEKNENIRNYQSRWRELRELLEKQAAQKSVQPTNCILIGDEVMAKKRLLVR
jgi:phosphopantetheine adenylyltransferase